MNLFFFAQTNLIKKMKNHEALDDAKHEKHEACDDTKAKKRKKDNE